MKFLIFLSFAALSTPTFAEVAPGHVDDMLKQMVAEKVISPEEGERARIKLMSMNKEQWTKINDQAEKVAARTPASVNGASNNQIQEVNGIDLDGAQFKQIQNDMRMIVPQSQD